MGALKAGENSFIIQKQSKHLHNVISSKGLDVW
jgi:hypothetical protein